MAPVRTRSRTRSTSSGLSLAPSWSVTSKRSMTSPSSALTFADRTSTRAAANDVGQRVEQAGAVGAADLAHRVPRRRGAVEGHLGVGERHRLDRAARPPTLMSSASVAASGRGPKGTWNESSTAPSGQVASTPSSTTSWWSASTLVMAASRPARPARRRRSTSPTSSARATLTRGERPGAGRAGERGWPGRWSACAARRRAAPPRPARARRVGRRRARPRRRGGARPGRGPRGR